MSLSVSPSLLLRQLRLGALESMHLSSLPSRLVIWLLAGAQQLMHANLSERTLTAC